MSDSEDEEGGVEIKGNKKQDDESLSLNPQEAQKSQALALINKKKEEKEELKKKNIFKDPKAKQIAIECAMTTIKVKSKA